jgi:hypothetical protein
MRQSKSIALPFFVRAGTRRAEGIVQGVFRDYPGSLAVRLWDDRTLAVGRGAPEFTLVFRNPRPFRELTLYRDLLRFEKWPEEVSMSNWKIAFRSLGICGPRPLRRARRECCLPVATTTMEVTP